MKQFVGEFLLGSGARVYLRDFGVYNQTLFDDILSDFAPLRASDVLVLNWGAWYPRFAFYSNEVGLISLTALVSSGVQSETMFMPSEGQLKTCNEVERE